MATLQSMPKLCTNDISASLQTKKSTCDRFLQDGWEEGRLGVGSTEKALPCKPRRSGGEWAGYVNTGTLMDYWKVRLGLASLNCGNGFENCWPLSLYNMSVVLAFWWALHFLLSGNP